MYDVSLVIRQVGAVSDDHLLHLTERLTDLGAVDPAVVYYPEDNEIGFMFQIKEDTLGRLLQPEGDRAAA